MTMQTFLPYPDFRESAKVLDMKRLGKQRVEAYQILCCLLGVSCMQWKNHPAVKMWVGHEYALVDYIISICQEWIGRGYCDTVLPKTIALVNAYMAKKKTFSKAKPWWVGNVEFHQSHQSNLIRKNSRYYKKDFPLIDPCLPYIWPIPEEEQHATLKSA